MVQKGLFCPAAGVKLEESSIIFELVLIQNLAYRFQSKLNLCTDPSSNNRMTQSIVSNTLILCKSKLNFGLLY